MASASKDSVLAAVPKSIGLCVVQSRETGVLLALVLMVVVLAVAAPEFVSIDNLLNDTRNLSLGLAIPVISSDLPEVLTISDCILVMREGRMAGELSHTEATEERIMALTALEQVEAA